MKYRKLYGPFHMDEAEAGPDPAPLEAIISMMPSSRFEFAAHYEPALYIGNPHDFTFSHISIQWRIKKDDRIFLRCWSSDTGRIHEWPQDSEEDNTPPKMELVP